MSAERKLMGTTDATGGPANYVEDVFSTYLYTGNGASQTINNGIALADGFSLTPGTALAGGYFGGFISTSGTGVATHALIVAPKASGEAASVQWKTTNTSTAGTSSVIDGPANSAAMNNASHPAAQFCEGLTIGGYSDWYMPAKNELEVLYYFLKPTTQANSTTSGSNANAVSPEPISTNYTSGSPAQTSATAFQSGGAEAFSAGGFFSSTEASATNAWIHAFTDGNQFSFDKTGSGNVRAVRRVAIADAILDPYRVTGKGGLVWIKVRSTEDVHALFDTARGVNNAIQTQSTIGQATLPNSLTAFNANGFSLGSDGAAIVNASGQNYASWTFREQAKFFDVVTYTGNATNPRTIAHNLGSVPGMIIVKRTDTTGDWWTYHRSTGAGAYLKLNTTDASVTSASFWGTGPTSTSFSVNAGALNASGGTYIAYLFAHNAGGFGASGTDNVISCGSFTGGDTVTLGYEPQWILTKRTSSTSNWYLYDVMRGIPTGGNSANLYANLANAEATTVSNEISVTSTGFNTPGLGGTWIYMAIRRGPMRTPTSGTSVFSPTLWTGTNTTTTISGIGFPPDVLFDKSRATANAPEAYDRLRGLNQLQTSNTGAETALVSGYDITAYGQDGYNLGPALYSSLNFSGRTNVLWNFRRAPGFFDVVCYTGTGAATTQAHNLGVVPEMMIVKARSAIQDWPVYAASLGSTGAVFLNTTASSVAGLYWNSTLPTTSVFSVGIALSGSATTYVAYLFASVPGVSKVGSYTGTGAAQTINCGFTAGARFVLIKRTDSTGDWYTFDTARGMVSGTDPYLLMNSTAAEVNANNVFTSSTGFTIQAAAPAGINGSGGTFIYLAVA